MATALSSPPASLVRLGNRRPHRALRPDTHRSAVGGLGPLHQRAQALARQRVAGLRQVVEKRLQPNEALSLNQAGLSVAPSWLEASFHLSAPSRTHCQAFSNADLSKYFTLKNGLESLVIHFC